MSRGRPTQAQRDFIKTYLAEEAQKGYLSQELIDRYREVHKDRLKWGKVGWSAQGIHPHGNNPYCNICDQNLHVGDYVYFFFVRALLMYHVDCFNNTGERKKLSILYQDRGYRKRRGI